MGHGRAGGRQLSPPPAARPRGHRWAADQVPLAAQRSWLVLQRPLGPDIVAERRAHGRHRAGRARDRVATRAGSAAKARLGLGRADRDRLRRGVQQREDDEPGRAPGQHPQPPDEREGQTEAAAQAEGAEDEHVSPLENAERTGDRERQELDPGAEGIDREGDAKGRADVQPAQHEIDLEAPHQPADEVDEDAREDGARALPIGCGEHAVEPHEAAHACAGAPEPEPVERAQRPTTEPGILHEHEGGDDDDLKTEQGRHRAQEVGAQRETPDCDHEPRGEKEDLSDRDGSLVHHQGRRGFGHWHPGSQEVDLHRLPAHRRGTQVDGLAGKPDRKQLAQGERPAHEDQTPGDRVQERDQGVRQGDEDSDAPRQRPHWPQQPLDARRRHQIRDGGHAGREEEMAAHLHRNIFSSHPIFDILDNMTLSGNRQRAALGIFLLLFGAALVTDHVVAAWALRCRVQVLDLVVGILNPIGSGITLLIACAALAVLARRLRRLWLQDAAWLAALAFVSAGAVEFTLKHLVGRPRPDAAMATAGLLGPSFAADIDSFPSGHATSVFAVAAVFATYYPRLRWPLYGLAAAIALGRVYLERHYLSDIIAGAALGLTVAVRLYRYRLIVPGRMILERAVDRSARSGGRPARSRTRMRPVTIPGLTP